MSVLDSVQNATEFLKFIYLIYMVTHLTLDGLQGKKIYLKQGIKVIPV